MVRVEFIMNAVKEPLVVGLGNPVAVARSNRILDVDVSKLIATLSEGENCQVGFHRTSRVYVQVQHPRQPRSVHAVY